MKNKILKFTSVVILISMIATIIMPSIVKSSRVVVASINNTSRGIGDTKVCTVKIDGYSNIYCVRGGASLDQGVQLDDAGSIYYNAFTDITSNINAVRWLTDNMYLTEITDQSIKNDMKTNLKNIMKQYAKKSGSKLAKATGQNTVSDDWINKAIDKLETDPSTLYAAQQYALWSFVKNTNSSYNNKLENSDGTYNKLPNANVEKEYYVGLYVTLREMAKEAQNNGYSSGNSLDSSKIELVKDNSTKLTRQNDKKTVLMGPYTIQNNNSQLSKKFSATITNGNNTVNASKIETVDVNGKTVNMQSYTGKFYFKITYNNGFVKGNKYSINVNIEVNGYKTQANVLKPVADGKQPLIYIRKEKLTKKLTTTLNYDEKITGKYNLEILKIGEDSKPLSGVKFVVKKGTESEKTYSDKSGIITVEENMEINRSETITYTINEISVNDSTYAMLRDSFKINVELGTVNEEYVPVSVKFDNGKDYKEVALKNGTTVKLTASISGNTVKITVPNSKITGSYSLDLVKVDEKGNALSGVTFKVKKSGENTETTYNPTGTDGKINIGTKNITSEGIDTYTITELKTKEGYITLNSPLTIYVSKKKQDYKYIVQKVTFDPEGRLTKKEIQYGTELYAEINFDEKSQKITVTIPNQKIEGKYDLRILKIDEKNEPIQGINFRVQQGQNSPKYYSTGANGVANIIYSRSLENVVTDSYTIHEVGSKDNQYITLDKNNPITLYVTKTTENNKYIPLVSFEKGVEGKDEAIVQAKLQDGSKVTVTAKIEKGKVTVTVPNKKVTGNYSLELEKVNLENESEKIDGVTFKVKDENNEEKTYGPTDSEGKISVVENKEIKTVGVDEYTITEINAEGSTQLKENSEIIGYAKLNESFKIYVTKEIKDNSYKVTNVSFERDSEVKTKKVTLEDGSKVTLKTSIVGNTVKITIPNKPIVKPSDFDMALRKYISKVIRDGKEINIGEDRTPVINEFSATEYEETKTAGYYHTKTPVKVKPGDTVLYTIRVYNEGNVDGYAKEITDYLPQELEYIENSKINKENNWNAVVNADGTTTVTTNKLKDTLITSANGAEGFSDYAKLSNNTDPKFSNYVQIECRVKSNVQNSKLLVDVAEITNYGYTDKNGEYIEANKKGVDIDSQEKNIFIVNTGIKNIDEYYEKVVVPQNTNDNKHYKGMQDDDDFENVYVEPDELKFKFVLNKVDEAGNPLIGADFTVERTKDNDTKVLLNNQEVKGTYEVIENDVKYNKTYSYKVVEVESAPEYVNVMQGKYITLRTYMNENRKLVLGNYEKVAEEDALIQKYGFVINNTDGSIVKENETDLYKKIKVYIKNDIGLEQIVITIPNEREQKDFDLALRKYITSVTKGVGTDAEKQIAITNRVPVFKINEKGEFVYEHTKDPLVVANANIVTYALRVYNEGDIDGYAKLIKDNIPEGLEFLPEEPLNKVFRWIMLDKDGKETKEVKNAVYVVSDYLSKQQEKVPGENLIKAFNKEDYVAGKIKEPYYKEVRISFKVDKKDKFDEIVINQAQISEHTDKDGNNIEDKDSTPDKWIEGEDDQDIEKIKVQYFDLSLRKWVTKAITIENGIQTVNKTGHKAEDDPEQIVKVDLKQSAINDVTVKFEYSIRVTNEGQIAGYAKEISDYIPEGLKFVKEDNPDWKEVEGKVVTEKLANKLLKPGESAEVTILLTWINSEKNMGLKVNTAEISKDYNEEGSNDIDSTPNNKVPGEDDIDDAPVMLTVKTGQEVTYITLFGTVLIMLAGGVALIKKFVLK